MTDSVELREARPEDAEQMLRLIQELAEYEKAGDEVSVVAADLIRDGFGPSAAFQCVIAQRGSDVVAMALLYDRYSTWKGRTLYLEDLIVTERARGQGIGASLLKECISRAEQGDYKRLEWQVLDWNHPAIAFYKKMSVEMDESWINCRLRF